MAFSPIDLDRLYQSGVADGVARAVLRQGSPLCDAPGVYLVTPSGWAAVVDPEARLSAEAGEAMSRGGMDLLTNVRRVAPPTATRPMKVRVEGWVQQTRGGRLEPDPVTDVMASRLEAVDDLGHRIARMPHAQLRALCTSVIRSEGIEEFPHSGSAWGRPWDVPGGWVHRALSLIAEVERSLPSLGGPSLALVQASVLLSDRPVAVEPDGEMAAGQVPPRRGSAVAAVEDALARLPALARAYGLGEGIRLRLLQLMVALATEEGAPVSFLPLPDLREIVRNVEAEWMSLRRSIRVVGP